MSWMLEEIHQQPEAVKLALDAEMESVVRLSKVMHEREINHILIAARGTSDHAATYAKYLIEIICGVPVTLAAPSVFTMYNCSMKLNHTLAIGISQSGQSEDVVQALVSARTGGALTACITNEPNSPITQASEYVILCHSGVEKSVAATKTYTCSLALVSLLTAVFSNSAVILEELSSISDKMQTCLEIDSEVSRLVERYRYMQECAVLARGINLSTALETALKITETSYLVSRPFSGADFLHGPIAMITTGFPVFVFAPTGKAFNTMYELSETLNSRGAELIIVSENQSILSLAQTSVEIPVNVHEYVSPLVYILFGQLWACHLAISRGMDPDHPRGLNKVTNTR